MMDNLKTELLEQIEKLTPSATETGFGFCVRTYG